jgi:hypothetical protein
MARITRDRLALYSAALAEKGLRAPRAAPIPLRAERTRAPLSRAQERLFFLELYQPGTPLYNDALAVRIEGELDEVRLARAAQAVAERHEVLRSSFVLAGAGPEQRIHAPGELAGALAVRDLAASDEPRAAARRAASEEARRPFDLERGPPWRATLLRLAPGEALFVLAMHHIVSDGASMGLYFDELAAAYADPRAARAPLAVQFGDYAAFERAPLDAGRAERERAHWREALAQAGVLAWPERRGAARQVGAEVPLLLGAELTARLAARARELEATSNHWLLSAWLAWLGARCGSATACSGFASSLRARRELEPLIGFFVQSLPLVLELDGTASFAEHVRRTRAAAFAAVEHGTLPFDEIARARGGTPLALQAFFSHMREAIRPPALGAARTSFEFVDPGVARFELALVLHETPTELRGFLEVDHGVFAPEDGPRLAGEWQRFLGATLANPAAPLAELAACAGLPRTERRLSRTLPPRRAAGA